MNLSIPDGAHIHIVYGSATPLALAAPSAAAASGSRIAGRLLRGCCAVALLVGAFQAGRLLPRGSGAVDPAQASGASSASAVAAQPGVPPPFRDALAQQPQVSLAKQPSSAQAPPLAGAAAPAASPFGLHE